MATVRRQVSSRGTHCVGLPQSASSSRAMTDTRFLEVSSPRSKHHLSSNLSGTQIVDHAVRQSQDEHHCNSCLSAVCGDQRNGLIHQGKRFLKLQQSPCGRRYRSGTSKVSFRRRTKVNRFRSYILRGGSNAATVPQSAVQVCPTSSGNAQSRCRASLCRPNLDEIFLPAAHLVMQPRCAPTT